MHKYVKIAALAGIGGAVFAVDAFAGGGNAIATMLQQAVTAASACGAGVATVGCIGAAGALATSNHGIVSPCLKGAGGGTAIAASAELVGLVLPGGGGGASLAMPGAFGVADYLHILTSLIA